MNAVTINQYSNIAVFFYLTTLICILKSVNLYILFVLARVSILTCQFWVEPKVSGVILQKSFEVGPYGWFYVRLITAIKSNSLVISAKHDTNGCFIDM